MNPVFLTTPQLPKSKVNKREGIEEVLNTVKERNDTTLRRYRYAESDYKDLLSVEKKWKKLKDRDPSAKEMDLMVFLSRDRQCYL
jgi:hypothetical protein